jgi:hypothetical protein
MPESNRRHFLRKKLEDTIQVLLTQDDFESCKDSCNLIPAKIVNQSDVGLNIEINRDLQPGSNVRIKKVFQEESCFDEVYYIRDGLVIWCEKVDDPTPCFKVGISILRKFIRATL